MYYIVFHWFGFVTCALCWIWSNSNVHNVHLAQPIWYKIETNYWVICVEHYMMHPALQSVLWHCQSLFNRQIHASVADCYGVRWTWWCYTLFYPYKCFCGLYGTVYIGIMFTVQFEPRLQVHMCRSQNVHYTYYMCTKPRIECVSETTPVLKWFQHQRYDNFKIQKGAFISGDILDFLRCIKWISCLFCINSEMCFVGKLCMITFLWSDKLKEWTCPFF